VDDSPQTYSFDIATPAAGKQASLFQSVGKLLRVRSALQPGERVVVGVSGGADSTALALILSQLRDRESFGLDLHFAHFNHQLRTEAEAEADAQFVRSLAAGLNIPFSSEAADVRSFARLKHLSLEDAARRLRYAFLGREAQRIGATAVAVGHTADDQAETVLLHLIRGAGMRGLRGMTLRTAWPFGKGPDLVRPLLNLRRSDTEFYCRKSGMVPRTDPTNLATDVARNRVRHLVMPAMREVNPRVGEALSRLATSLEADLDYLERQAALVWNALAAGGKRSVEFTREGLQRLEPALAVRLISRAAQEAGGHEATPSHEHLQRALDLVRSDRARWRLSFPGGVTVSGRSDITRVGLGNPPRGAGLAATALEVPGAVDVNGWAIRATCESAFAEPADDPHELLLSSGTVRGRLVVRSRRNGDRMRPLGLGGTKKVQDILVDRKVPAEERDQVPLICDDEGILWIVGHCVDERAVVTLASGGVIRLAVRRLKRRGASARIKGRARGSKPHSGGRRRAL
jgi:tRNA(Ile)-lysidine synthetase-like protein